MNDEGGMPNTSPRGFISALLGGLNDSAKLPLHDAVLRERDEREPLPLPLLMPVVVVPLFEMLSMLANLCMFIDNDAVGFSLPDV